MRVVRRLAANTADVVGLGEDLQLRIEIDQVTNQSPVFISTDQSQSRILRLDCLPGTWRRGLTMESFSI